MKPELIAFWKYGADVTEQLRAENAAKKEAENSALIQKLERYEKALLRIMEQSRDHEALIVHRGNTGQEVSAGDREVWHAYRETAKLAASALRLAPDALR